MTIATVMAGVASVVKTISDYSADNVAVNDKRVLDKGPRKAVNVWRQTGHTRKDLTLGNPKTVENQWIIGVDVYFLAEGDPQAVMTNLEAEAILIMDAFSSYQNLNGTSGVLKVDASMPESREVMLVPDTNYFRQLVNVTVFEHEHIAVLEGAGA